jgi:putative membrane protein
MKTANERGFLGNLLVRWIICSFGLWIAAGLFSGSVSLQNNLSAVIVAGLILALINTTLKPLLVVMSVPFIVLTLGLFMIVINGITVYLASKLYAPLEVSSFGAAIVTGMVIGLVNYLVTAILE